MSRRKFLRDIATTSIVAPLSVNGIFEKAEQNGSPNAAPSQQDLENETRLLRDKLLADPLRPTFHFVVPEGNAYPFDANGAIFWKGKYHLGYIFQHNDAKGNRIHWWGHVVSHDLFHWSALPPMLTVEPGDPETGIYSGGAFLSKEGVPHVVYHGTESGNCIAKAVDDELIKWEKFKQNPVLPLKKYGALTERKTDNSNNAWDPHIWLEGDIYYQISGGNPAALFKSSDLLSWKYIGTFMDETKRMRNDSEDWSCPDFFKLGKKYVAVAISHNLGNQYYIGDFVNEQFIPEKHERMNWYGGTFFAPESLVDDKGRRILWGWVLERREYNDAQGWSGTMSMPRVLSLNAKHEMVISPPEEVQLLRYNKKVSVDLKFNDAKEVKLDFGGNTIELHATFAGSRSGVFGLKVLCSPDGKEETIIKYDPEKKQIVIDYINSAEPGNVKFPSYCMMGYLDKSVPEFVSEQRAPFALKAGEDLKLEVFIDKSIIEVFVNRSICVTQRVYPTRTDSVGVHVFSEGKGSLKVSGLQCWQMAKTNFC